MTDHIMLLNRVETRLAEGRALHQKVMADHTRADGQILLDDELLRRIDELPCTEEMLAECLPALRAAAAQAVELACRVEYRSLRLAERIGPADQLLAEDCLTWRPAPGWMIGLPYQPASYRPMRRPTE